MKTILSDHRDRLIVALLVLCAALVTGVITYFLLFTSDLTDIQAHVQFARDLLTGQVAAIHAMLQVLIIGLSPLVSMETAALIVTVIFYSVTAALIYAVLRGSTKRRWLAALVALCLLIVAPISLLTWNINRYYLGYVGINVFHSPTMELLKPFALLIMLFALRVLNGAAPLNWRTVGLGALLIALALFAKPNFVLAFLPALIAYAAYRLYRGSRIGLPVLVAALIVPMIVLLGLQYVLQFVITANGVNGIAIAPLETVSRWESARWWIPVKLLMSIAFPLSVLVLYWNEARQQVALGLSWLTFLSGAAQMYLLTEVGERADHGNFWWSAQIGLFVLFVFSARFWITRLRNEPRSYVTAIIFALHVISGIAFAVRTLTAGAYAGW
ncbi:MAG: hypothetical protein IAE80_26855 [Anaerolinea sp.]|nr:hypothetical protein [Anaerolinea sp.]